MNTFLKAGMVSALALATTAPAFAQYYQPTPDYQRQQREYENQYGNYEANRQNYEANRQNYEARREGYQVSAAQYQEARRDYDRRLALWERERARYDARYGYGAYARRTARPIWDDAYWARAYPSAPYAGTYGNNVAYTSCKNNSSVTAGVIGALIGGVLGSNVAARNARTEGAVLGAVVGGAIGAGVGNANDKYKCDDRGPYFSYNETVPYRESRSWRYGTRDNAYYTNQRCRLAPAPVDSYGRDYRYVRVCPDVAGRYRITG